MYGFCDGIPTSTIDDISFEYILAGTLNGSAEQDEYSLIKATPGGPISRVFLYPLLPPCTAEREAVFTCVAASKCVDEFEAFTACQVEFGEVCPTTAPTVTPSAAPTAAPSATPSGAPFAAPSVEPSATPSAAPSTAPYAAPSAVPSASVVPSSTPSAAPSSAPSAAPSETCSDVCFDVDDVQGIAVCTIDKSGIQYHNRCDTSVTVLNPGISTIDKRDIVQCGCCDLDIGEVERPKKGDHCDAEYDGIIQVRKLTSNRKKNLGKKSSVLRRSDN